MQKRIIRIVALLIALFFLLGVIAPVLVSKVYGAPQGASSETQKKSPWQQVQDYEKELSELSEENIRLGQQKTDCEAELEMVQKELEIAEKTEKKQHKNFRDRFVVLCDRGLASYLEILFSAESISDLIEKFVIVREIAEYDKNTLNTIATVKGQIIDNKQRLEELLVEIEQSGKELKSNEDEVKRKLGEAKAYHERLEQDEEAYGQYLAEKDEAEQKTREQAGIGNEVGTVEPGRIGSGALAWPSNSSYITSEFAPSRVNPVSGEVRPHTGTDIGANQGSPVWASRGGTIVMAQENGGYGNCIIIDHGGGVKTLYGHLSAILVNNGQKVTQGMQIGRVGSTGNSTGPHLHYEVLIDGVAVDPMQFF